MTNLSVDSYVRCRNFQATLLIPLNARLSLAMSSELDEELEVVADNEDIEDDTL